MAFHRNPAGALCTVLTPVMLIAFAICTGAAHRHGFPCGLPRRHGNYPDGRWSPILLRWHRNQPARKSAMTIRATWAFNGQTKIILGNWHRLWCLLFGPFYYLFKGMFCGRSCRSSRSTACGSASPCSTAPSCCAITIARGGCKNDRPSSLPPEWNPAHDTETQRECGLHEKAQQFGFGSHPTD